MEKFSRIQSHLISKESVKFEVLLSIIMDTDQVSRLIELEDRLSKIRNQTNSKLDNQKHVAIILSAVEENIDDQQSTNKNIVNYLISFMSLLDQSVNENTKELQDPQLAKSAIYLLDLVFQYTPKTILRSRFSEILTKISPCITDVNADAPIVKGGIGCLESLLIAQDSQSWCNNQNLHITPTRGLNGLLELTLDSRPKVRKRAQEAISKILSNPPAAPTSEHIASPLVANFTISLLINIMEDIFSSSNKKLNVASNTDELNSKIIHTLTLINMVVRTRQWPSSLIEKLCDLLLEIIKTSNQFLVSNSFKCFESLFQSVAQTNSDSGLAEDKFLWVLDIIFSLKPSNKDSQLASAWISVVTNGLSTYSNIQPLKCLLKIPQIFELISFYLSSETPEIYSSASQCLIELISIIIKDELLLYPPLVPQDTFDTVNDIISELSNHVVELLSIKYTHCMRDILNVLASIIKKLRYRCNPNFIKVLTIVGEWRTNEESILELKNEVEIVIGAAIKSMGVDVVLNCLPLNLQNLQNDKPGRAWLIPLIRDYAKNSMLSIFINQFLPLIKFVESKTVNLKPNSMQLKVFQTLVDQIWSTLPRFCDLTVDLESQFTDDFASELSSLLYSKVELRRCICHALKVLVESNIVYTSSQLSDDALLHQHFPIDNSKKNLEFLATKSSNLLAVLFNVYTQTSPDHRGYILETIDFYLQITKADDLFSTFNNVCGLLNNALEQESKNDQPTKEKSKLSATLLDLIVVMVKYVPESSYNALFFIFNATVNSPDSLIQKRSYRIISKLSEVKEGSAAISSYITNIENIMLSAVDNVQVPAKSLRLIALKTLVEILPLDHLSFIVQVVPEVILSTKDVNEKSREAAYNTLISMANKMNQPNGCIKLSQLAGYNVDSPDQPSSIGEFFKIISAGLIGESQHMVSATITAFSCLIFEFKDQVEEDVLLDIYDTIELYLTSNSREIVKSTIGFSKVCCLSLPEQIMRQKIPNLLPKLLRWSHEHTGHFKAKIKHIIERLIRRFGYEFIETNFPEEDMKLLANIRKTRNRNKRKQGDENQEGFVKSSNDSYSVKGSGFMSALDDALYSSSEKDVSDSEIPTKKKKGKSTQFIVESKDTPLDLLDTQALAHISSTRPKKIKNGQRKIISDDMLSFDTEGKLMVKNETNKHDDPLASITSGINAYLEAVEHGPVRGQKNKLKFRKSNNVDNNEFSDDESHKSDFKSRKASKNRISKQKKNFRNHRKL